MPPYTPPQRNEIVDWYQSIPPITKAIFTVSLAAAVAPTFNLIDPLQLILNWTAVSKLQLWRLATCFFVNRLGLAFAMNLYFMYRYSTQLETEVFGSRTADYVYYHLITGLLQLAAARYLNLYVLSDGFLLSIAYLWSQHYREVPVTFMFGIRFKALYLPWVLVAYDFLASGALPVPSLVGIAASHIYYYLATIYPSQGGRQFLTTPAFLQRMFPPSMQHQGGFTTGGAWGGRQQQQQQQQQQARQTANMFGGHRWGHGQRLGS